MKRFEQYFLAIFKLGKTEWNAKFGSREVSRISDELATLKQELETARNLFQRVSSELVDTNNDIQPKMREMDRRAGHVESLNAEISRWYSDLSRRLDMVLLSRDADGDTPERGAAVCDDIPSALKSEGFQTFQDVFYNRLENRYRGSRSDIKARMKIYLPDVESAFIRTEGKPVLDLGCGRGEWLEVLRERDVPAIGIDTNQAQIEEALALGLDVRHGDALQAMADANDNSYSVISAHHLIEHLPFESVAWIAREAGRVLAPGGILIFETPNPRNIMVGASSFYNDPTHRNPVTESVLEVLFETVGFCPVEARPLHPHERLDEFLQRPGFDPDLAQILFGPQDLAMLGTKPAGAR
jgi:SAM-dependent methyltransferase